MPVIPAARKEEKDEQKHKVVHSSTTRKKINVDFLANTWIKLLNLCVCFFPQQVEKAAIRECLTIKVGEMVQQLATVIFQYPYKLQRIL